MNNNSSNSSSDFLISQIKRLQTLIQEVSRCCDDKKLIESRKFLLPYAEIKCLMLFNGGRYLTVKNIAQSLDVAKSRVTKLVNGLKEKEIVSSIDDPNDSRIRLISLTPAGKKVMKEIEAFHKEIHHKILEHLSGDEKKNVFFGLELLKSAMEAVKEELIK